MIFSVDLRQEGFRRVLGYEWGGRLDDGCALIGLSIVNGVRHLESEASEVTRVSHTEKVLSSLSC